MSIPAAGVLVVESVPLMPVRARGLRQVLCIIVINR